MLNVCLSTGVPSPVAIEVDPTSFNSRRVYASIGVAAPVETVWSALTDYDNLGSFIPSLVENRCLEHSGNVAVLYQVEWGGAVAVSCACMGSNIMKPCTHAVQLYRRILGMHALLGHPLGHADAPPPPHTHTCFVYVTPPSKVGAQDVALGVKFSAACTLR